MMLFVWSMSVILSTICTVYGVWDQKCIDNVCSCCINRNCGHALGFQNACLKGCIDGHRGTRCYELCQYKNCKVCGDTGQSKECSKCNDGYYLGTNKDCTSQCPSNCISCTSSTMCTECKEGFYDKDGSTTCRYAYCPANCNCNGQGDCTSCKNEYYDTSTSCTKQCPVNCLACESDAKCSECKKGYYNGYEHDIETNIKLNTCSYTCRESCTQCQSYNNCSQCASGKYGNMCQDDCSVGCKEKTCSIDHGKCECTINFSGDKCLECVNEKYGSFCNQTCSKDCKGRICEKKSGDCTNGCKNANIIGNKCSLCKEGMYGEVCNMTCPKNCKNNKCERGSGICSDGCIVNFNGTKCNECINGKYGEKCERDCPEQCAGNICEKQSGNCFNCNINFRGKKCEECKLKYHGPNCDEPCSARCANFTCNRHTGRCICGCVSGFSGDRCCAMSENCIECYTNEKCKTCEPGFYKISCNETCPEGCNNGSCDILTGECILDKKINIVQCPMLCLECHSYTECENVHLDFSRHHLMKHVRAPGFFKTSLNETCPGSCSGPCNILTGECISRKESQQQNDVSNTGLIATAAVLGSLFSLSLAVNIVLLAVIILKGRMFSQRKHTREDREPTYENQLKSVGEEFPSTTPDVAETLHSKDVEINVYEGIRNVYEKEHEYQQVAYDPSNRL